jgi:hypothetical protein
MKNTILLIGIIVLSTVEIKAQVPSTSLKAMPDTFTVFEALTDTLPVTLNDSVPIGDSVCISLVSGSPYFSILNCKNILYHPDSTFTGRDTCRYALCDTAMHCDTATVIVYVDTNPALLPVAGFKQDSVLVYGNFGPYFYYTPLFRCTMQPPSCYSYTLSNTSIRYDSVSWIIKDTCRNCAIIPQTYQYSNIDTISFVPYNNLNYVGGSYIYIYITAYNKFGSTTFVDTSCRLWACTGIADVPLLSIYFYPNPASDIVFIDYSYSNESSPASIKIFNLLGQSIYERNTNGLKGNQRINVQEWPTGLYTYLVTSESGYGTSGVFVVSH